MKNHIFWRSAWLIALLLIISSISAQVARAQGETPEPTATFTPPPKATAKVTATEPAPPTATTAPTSPPTPTGTFTRTPTPLPPTATFTPPPTLQPTATDTPDATQTQDPTNTPDPTATNTPVSTSQPAELSISVQDEVTEGDRFLVILTLNRPLACDLDRPVAGNNTINPAWVLVTIPAGKTTLDFWLFADPDGETTGQRSVRIRIGDWFAACEPVTLAVRDDYITIYDPSTAIPEEQEPSKYKLNLPLIRSAIDSRGVMVGLFAIVIGAVFYTRKRK